MSRKNNRNKNRDAEVETEETIELPEVEETPEETEEVETEAMPEETVETPEEAEEETEAMPEETPEETEETPEEPEEAEETPEEPEETEEEVEETPEEPEETVKLDVSAVAAKAIEDYAEAFSGVFPGQERASEFKFLFLSTFIPAIEMMTEEEAIDTIRQAIEGHPARFAGMNVYANNSHWVWDNKQLEIYTTLFNAVNVSMAQEDDGTTILIKDDLVNLGVDEEKASAFEAVLN